MAALSPFRVASGGLCYHPRSRPALASRPRPLTTSHSIERIQPLARTPRKWTGARSPSGLKRVRSSERRHEVLGPRRAAAKTLVRHALEVATTHTDQDPQAALAEAMSALDRAAKSGAIHPNAAARRKSRLALKVNDLLAGTTIVAKGKAKTVGRAQAQKAAKARIAAGKAGKAKGAQTAAGKARAALTRTTRAEAAAEPAVKASAASKPAARPAAKAKAPAAKPATKPAAKKSTTAAKVKTATKATATKAKTAAKANAAKANAAKSTSTTKAAAKS
jgi:ribosomal protein S20